MSRADPPSPELANQIGQAPIGFREFVALTASLMALGALGIDAMLPALPAIGAALDVAAANDRQLVITAFLAGFGAAQLVHGPLADRYGRRTTLLASLAIYLVCNVLAAVSGSFALLLAARVAGGCAVAATRVSSIAIVRDCYSGPAMARVMSITFVAFMAVPILAPAFGAAVLLVAEWRAIFWTIAGVSGLVLAWFAARMPETLHPEDRAPLSLARVAAGWRIALSDRLSVGYTFASAALMAALYGYLNSIQQVVADVFGRPNLLVPVFAAAAGTIAVANLLNARLVMRLGTRLISHGAVTVLLVVSAIHLALGLAGAEVLGSFVILQALSLGCFGLAGANFGALAMERMGHIAGTASSVQGAISMTLGTVGGALIGRAFDGTTVPLSAGFALAAAVALAIVAVTERGGLYARG